MKPSRNCICALLMQAVSLILVDVHGVGSQSSTPTCNHPIISPVGVQIVDAGATVSVSCTIRTEEECDAVRASLRRYKDGAIINHHHELVINTDSRCTFNSSVEMNGTYASLFCGLAHITDLNCTSEPLHLLVSPVLEEVSTNNTDIELYTCTTPCNYVTHNLFTKNGSENVGDVINSNVADITAPDLPFECIGGYRTIGIELNVSKSCFTDIIPDIACGGRDPWNNGLILSEKIYRNRCNIFNITTTTTEDPPTITSYGTPTSSAIVNSNIALQIFYIQLLYFALAIYRYQY